MCTFTSVCVCVCYHIFLSWFFLFYIYIAFFFLQNFYFLFHYLYNNKTENDNNKKKFFIHRWIQYISELKCANQIKFFLPLFWSIKQINKKINLVPLLLKKLNVNWRRSELWRFVFIFQGIWRKCKDFYDVNIYRTKKCSFLKI